MRATVPFQLYVTFDPNSDRLDVSTTCPSPEWQSILKGLGATTWKVPAGIYIDSGTIPTTRLSLLEPEEL